MGLSPSPASSAATAREAIGRFDPRDVHRIAIHHFIGDRPATSVPRDGHLRAGHQRHFRMPNWIGRTIGHMHDQWLEWLLSEMSLDFLGSHNLHSIDLRMCFP